MDQNAPQPSPELTPNQPVTPPTEAPAALPQNPKKTPTKLIIILASVIGGVILLAIIALVVFLAFFTVSKKDYEAALTQYNTVSEANSDLSSAASNLAYDSGSATDTVFNNDADKVQSALGKLKDENTKLGTLKAMQVGEGQKQYATFSSKLNAYITATGNLLSSVKTARPALKTCDAVNNATSQTDQTSAIKACATSLKSVSSVSDQDVQQYITSLQTNYSKLADIMTQISAISDPYGDSYDQYSALRDQADTIETTISNAGSDYSSNLGKHQDQVDPSDAAKSLGSFLEKQVQ